MAPLPLVRNHRHIHHPGGHEHPPAPGVPLEPVADGLSQFSCPRRLLPVLAPILGVVGIAPQACQHLLIPVGKLHTRNDQVFAVLPRQRVRHSQPQGQRPVISNGRHAELATRRLIPAPQHEELVTAGVPPVPEPFLMAGVAVGLQMMLLAPQPLRPEAQPHSALSYVAFQCSQPDSQIGQPPFLLMDLIPPAMPSGIGDLLAQPVQSAAPGFPSAAPLSPAPMISCRPTTPAPR